MEKTKKNILIDFFKNIGRAFNKILNEGEVDEVELTGELAKDPEKVVVAYQVNKKSSPAVEKVINQTRNKEAKAKTPSPRVINNNQLESDIYLDDDREL